MVWKLFFIGCFIHHHTFKNLFSMNLSQVPVHSSVPIPYPVPYSVPSPFFTTKQDFNGTKQGHDNRYSELDNSTDIIFNITRFHKQMDLLRALENKNLSLTHKLEILKKFETLDSPSPMKYNFLQGGLFDEWNYNMN